MATSPPASSIFRTCSSNTSRASRLRSSRPASVSVDSSSSAWANVRPTTTTWSFEPVLRARSIATLAASSAWGEPSVANNIRVGKLLNVLPPHHKTPPARVRPAHGSVTTVTARCQDSYATPSSTSRAFWTGKEHAGVERPQVLFLGDPALLFYKLFVRDGDLADAPPKCLLVLGQARGHHSKNLPAWFRLLPFSWFPSPSSLS